MQGIVESGVQALSTASEKTVKDHEGNEYVVLKGDGRGTEFGGTDSNYSRNVKFPNGLPAEIVEWSKLPNEEFFLKLQEAGMVAEDIPAEEAVNVISAIARATNVLNVGKWDSVFLDVPTTADELLPLNGELDLGFLPESWELMANSPGQLLTGWVPDEMNGYTLPSLIHDGRNRYAQPLDDEGEPVAPLGAFNVSRWEEAGARNYLVNFPSIVYFYRVSDEHMKPYVDWMLDQGLDNEDTEVEGPSNGDLKLMEDGKGENFMLMRAGFTLQLWNGETALEPADQAAKTGYGYVVNDILGYWQSKPIMGADD